MKRLFVTGIGTEVGKTVASAVLARAWEMEYWKPVQAGELEYSDSDKVREWTGGRVYIHPEAFSLTSPMSPHAAANKDGVRIGLEEFLPPKHRDPLLIEGAGGLLVPLNEEGDCMLDLAEKLDAEILLVAKNFLGSINQTLLSCRVLASQKVPVRGILFSGATNEASERIIERLAGFPILGRIPEETPSEAMVMRNAERFSSLAPFS